MFSGCESQPSLLFLSPKFVSNVKIKRKVDMLAQRESQVTMDNCFMDKNPAKMAFIQHSKMIVTFEKSS